MVGVLTFESCKTPPPEPPMMTIEQLVLAAGLPETVQASSDSTTLSSEIDFSANWKCEEFEVDITQVNGKYRTFDPNSEIIWPGNLLQGASIYKATPDPIVVERAGGEFTINLINGSTNTQTSAPVSEVDQTRVVGALNEILANNNGLTPANFTFEISDVQSQSQLALEMGVNVSTLTTDIKTDLAFSQEKKYNRKLVDFSQIYYTMVYEKPTSFEQVFAPEVGVEDLQPYMGNGNPPVYISSVTYGRRFYLLIESTSSQMEMEAAISGTYNAALAKGGANVEVNSVKNLQEVKIKIFAMGGDAATALGAFDGSFTSLKDYLQAGPKDYLKAAPLSYAMRTLAHPQRIVDLKVSTSFTATSCTPLYEVGPPAFTHAWYGIFDHEGIGAACALDRGQDNVILFNQSGTKYAVIRGNQIQEIQTLGSGIGELANCPFDTAGTAQVIGSQIRVFNKDGLKYAWQHSDGSWGQVRDLYLWGVDGTHPFLNPPVGEAGVGVAFESRLSNETVPFSVHFNQLGTKYVVSEGEDFWEVSSLTNWGGNDYDMPFPSIGAGMHISTEDRVYAEQDTTKKERFEVLFNGDGTKFTIFASNGFSDVYSIVKEE